MTRMVQNSMKNGVKMFNTWLASARDGLQCTHKAVDSVLQCSQQQTAAIQKIYFDEEGIVHAAGRRRPVACLLLRFS